MKLIYTNGKNPDFISLCKQLDNNLNTIIGCDRQTIYCEYNHLDDIHDVWIAYEETRPVGCASFKQYADQIAEVKRVFVLPEYRGRGISNALMDALELKAIEKGFASLILETGRPLTTAIQLYQNRGYHIIQNYGQYECMGESVCMQKDLINT